MGRAPHLLPHEVLDLHRDVLGLVSPRRPLRHTAPQEIQGVYSEALRQLVEVLAEFERRRPCVDAVHQEQRLTLPRHRVREVPTLPPVVAHLTAEPVRKSPTNPLQPPVVERQPPAKAPDRQERRPQLHPASSEILDARIVPKKRRPDSSLTNHKSRIASE